MSISGHLADNPQSVGKEREARRTLSLDVAGALHSGEGAQVRIHNISSTGLLLECEARLAEGDLLNVDLPEAGVTRAKVVWQSGSLNGCRFDEPVSTATLSAAQLRSAVVAPVEIESASDGGASDSGESFGMRLRRLRKVRGFTLDQVAAQMGVSKPTVWAWEQDKARPVESRMSDLALALGVAESALSGGLADNGLTEVIARCRRDIANAARVAINRIRILIEL